MFNKNLTMLFAMATIVVSAWYANQAEAQYVKDGLIGYWSFDADTIQGDTVKDILGKNDGTLNFPAKIVAGKVGDALEFDGVSDHYLATKLMVGEEVYKELTMMAWAKPYKAHEAWGSVMNCDDGGWDRGFGYRIDSWEIQVGHGGDWQPGATIDVNKWQHVVVVYTPNEVTFYKNGERFDFGKAATPTTTVNPLIIGDDIPCGPNCSFPGAIDEVLVYGRALSESEVKQNFATEPTSVEPANKLAFTWGNIKASR